MNLVRFPVGDPDVEAENFASVLCDLEADTGLDRGAVLHDDVRIAAVVPGLLAVFFFDEGSAALPTPTTAIMPH